MKFFVYSRKSVYTGKGESIENQIELCRDYILANFPGASPGDLRVFEDEGYSGKTLDRPQFREMMAALERERPDCIVCYRLDRISRSVGDFAGLIETLNRKGVAFVCIREKFDTSTPMGKAMLYIASVFAQLERETIAERVRDNMALLARTGRWLGGQTPLGFTAQRVEEVILEGRVKRSCKLAPHPGELEKVRLIFDAFWSLRSLNAAARRLWEQQVFTRSGGSFSPLGIRDVLQNPVYCAADREAWDYFTAQGAQVCFPAAGCVPARGLLSYNKRDYTGERAARNPMEKWIIAVGRHPATIPGGQWVAIQKLLGRGAARPAAAIRAHNDYALLSGLIRCARCGAPMLAKPRSAPGAQGRRFDYICQTKLRLGTVACAVRNLNGREADALLDRFAAALRPYSAGLCRRLEALKHPSPRTGQPAAGQIAQKEGEVRRLAALLGRAEATPRLLRQVEARLGALEEELSALRREEPASVPSEAPLPALAGWKDLWTGMDLPERRALLRLLIQECRWDGETLEIHSYFLPAGGQNGPFDLSMEAHSQP